MQAPPAPKLWLTTGYARRIWFVEWPDPASAIYKSYVSCNYHVKSITVATFPAEWEPGKAEAGFMSSSGGGRTPTHQTVDGADSGPKTQRLGAQRDVSLDPPSCSRLAAMHDAPEESRRAALKHAGSTEAKPTKSPCLRASVVTSARQFSPLPRIALPALQR